MGERSHSSCAAFSLVEAMVVVIIAGILAGAAAPLIGSQGALRERAGAAEVSAYLQTARAFAMATGEAHGVRIGRLEGEVAIVRISEGAVVAMSDLFGEEHAAMRFDSVLPGVEIVRATDGAGVADPVTIWFGHDGGPQVRTNAGVLVESPTRDCEVEFASGLIVRVRAVSGAIE